MSYEDFSKSFFLIQGFCGVLVSKNLTLLINYDIQKYVNIANVKKISFFHFKYPKVHKRGGTLLGGGSVAAL